MMVVLKVIRLAGIRLLEPVIRLLVVMMILPAVPTGISSLAALVLTGSTVLLAMTLLVVMAVRLPVQPETLYLRQ
ncbi:hypothetical protein [Aliamphritea ceti]|uniref:hypothetical protein n=1 Tax=Aliamphritea ceti TaxID=1524258 RepID=UPI0021C2EEB5|nr:hypothetical protein [Aliamphritea ceti]